MRAVHDRAPGVAGPAGPVPPPGPHPASSTTPAAAGPQAADAAKAPGVAQTVEVTAFDETKNIAWWAGDERCQVGESTLRYRLRSGWDAEEAISCPARPIDTLYTIGGVTRLLSV